MPVSWSRYCRHDFRAREIKRVSAALFCPSALQQFNYLFYPRASKKIVINFDANKNLLLLRPQLLLQQLPLPDDRECLSLLMISGYLGFPSALPGPRWPFWRANNFVLSHVRQASSNSNSRH